MVRKKLITAIAILFLAACQLQKPSDGEKSKLISQTIDGDILPHVELFERLSGADVQHTVRISYGDNIGDIAGVCDEQFLTVTINRGEWVQLGKAAKENVIFHELGHCVYSRQHNSELITMGGFNDVPKDIMYPVLIKESYYQEFRKYYHQQFFGRTLSADEYQKSLQEYQSEQKRSIQTSSFYEKPFCSHK